MAHDPLIHPARVYVHLQARRLVVASLSIAPHVPALYERLPRPPCNQYAYALVACMTAKPRLDQACSSFAPPAASFISQCIAMPDSPVQ